MSSTEEDLLLQDAIQEYLRYFEFRNTLDCFQSEREQRTLLGNNKKYTEKSNVDLMMEAFDHGQEDSFFDLWMHNIDVDDRQLEAAMKLEFDIRLHMALFEVRLWMDLESSKVDQAFANRISHFQQYLDSRGSIFSDDQVYSQYFSLPFAKVKQLRQGHPKVFTPLLQPDWLLQKRRQVRAFLLVTVASRKRPILCDLGGFLTRKSKKSSTGMDSELDDQVHILHSKMEGQEMNSLHTLACDLIITLNQVRKATASEVELIVTDDYLSQMITALGDLEHTGRRSSGSSVVVPPLAQLPRQPSPRKSSRTSARSSSRSSDASSVTPKVSARAKSAREEQAESKYEELYVDTVHEESSQYDAREPPLKMATPATPLVSARRKTYVERPVFPKLDYPILKHDIKKLLAMQSVAANRQIVLLLQALRWRLSRTSLWKIKKGIIASYVEHDVLEMNLLSNVMEESKSEEEAPLIRQLQYTDGDLVDEYLVRYLVFLSCHPEGVTYLQQDVSLVSWICDRMSMYEWQYYNDERQFPEYALCLLQKLSMDSFFRVKILESGILTEHLIPLLSHATSQSDFVLQFALTMTMNVLLSQELESYLSEDDALTCIETFEHMLQQDSIAHLCYYVVASLYAVVRHPLYLSHLTSETQRYENHRRVLEHIIRDSQSLDEETKMQLSFIVQGIVAGSFPDSAVEENPAFVEEDTMPEDDTHENMYFQKSIEHHNVIQGEPLLMRDYLLVDESKVNTPTTARLRQYANIPEEMTRKPKISLG